MDMLFKFIKRPITIVTIVLVIGIVSGYFYFTIEKEPSLSTVVVKKNDIIQEVAVTGKVRPSHSVDLAFEKSGKVKRVKTRVGDKVNIGQVLIELDSSELVAQLREAEAKVEVEKAKLAELLQGTRPEEIAVQEVKVKNAKIALEDARRNIIDKLQDTYTKSDDAVRNKVDQFFVDPRSSDPRFSFSVYSQQARDTEADRISIETLLISWKTYLDEFTVSGDLTPYINNAKTNLSQVRSFLDKIALVINNLSSSEDLSQTTVDGYRSDVSTARADVNTATNNFSLAEEKLRTAESNVSLVENELVLKKAGSVKEQIVAAEAKVKQTEASVQNIQVQVAKTILRSPINGIVAKQDARIGEIVSASTIVVSIISEADFEIEANIPEADIAKIKIGNVARITLDAYGSNVIFEAVVFEIEPAETIIEGVATYKTTLQFLEEDLRIKSGMTANIDILADKRENVIAIPQRAVITKNGDTLVRVLKNGLIEEVKVKTGLRGSAGKIEIIAGINEGDEVIIFIKERGR